MSDYRQKTESYRPVMHIPWSALGDSEILRHTVPDQKTSVDDTIDDLDPANRHMEFALDAERPSLSDSIRCLKEFNDKITDLAEILRIAGSDMPKIPQVHAPPQPNSNEIFHGPILNTLSNSTPHAISSFINGTSPFRHQSSSSSTSKRSSSSQEDAMSVGHDNVTNRRSSTQNAVRRQVFIARKAKPQLRTFRSVKRGPARTGTKEVLHRSFSAGSPDENDHRPSVNKNESESDSRRREKRMTFPSEPQTASTQSNRFSTSLNKKAHRPSISTLIAHQSAHSILKAKRDPKQFNESTPPIPPPHRQPIKVQTSSIRRPSLSATSSTPTTPTTPVHWISPNISDLKSQGNEMYSPSELLHDHRPTHGGYERQSRDTDALSWFSKGSSSAKSEHLTRRQQPPVGIEGPPQPTNFKKWDRIARRITKNDMTCMKFEVGGKVSLRSLMSHGAVPRIYRPAVWYFLITHRLRDMEIDHALVDIYQELKCISSEHRSRIENDLHTIGFPEATITAVQNVLTGFGNYNTTVGYQEVMLGPVLLLLENFSEEFAFVCLTHLFRRYNLQNLLSPDSTLPLTLCTSLDRLLQAQAPPLAAHLEFLGIKSAEVAKDWFRTLFSTVLGRNHGTVSRLFELWLAMESWDFWVAVAYGVLRLWWDGKGDQNNHRKSIIRSPQSYSAPQLIQSLQDFQPEIRDSEKFVNGIMSVYVGTKRSEGATSLGQRLTSSNKKRQSVLVP